jgi:3-oxosteroid 1-dehydrogenase
MSARPTPLPPVPARDAEVDLLIVGSGTGMACALAAHELGLSVLVVEKTPLVGGSTARSGGGFWIPANPILAEQGTSDSLERAAQYLQAAVGDSAPAERWQSFLRHGPGTVDMLRRTTPMKFMWTRGYADYHPELPGGSAVGRTCECRPFNLSILGQERARLRQSGMRSLPMPITGADYKWMNLIARTPGRSLPRAARRAAQGAVGLALGREYVAGGQAMAAGLYAGVLRANIPVWTCTTIRELVTSGERVVGAILDQDGREVTVTTSAGVVLAAGGFDQDIERRRLHQSPSLQRGWSLGNTGNTGDTLDIAAKVGADMALMNQAWWFPAVAPLAEGQRPTPLLAERSLPGSFMVDDSGARFANEAADYMSFGQLVLARERAGDPVGTMWIIFDQRYRNNYVFATILNPRSPIPEAWFKAGIAHQAGGPAELARAAGLPEQTFLDTFTRFNALAAAGVDDDFGRGASFYDRYYGDPTVTPNPNLRPLDSTRLYAIKVVLGDLGTCGGIRADGCGRALRSDGTPITGLYAVGNVAANAFGTSYPGAGATIGQGLVFGNIVARHAAGIPHDTIRDGGSHAAVATPGAG